MKTNRILPVLLTALSILPASGCWNYKELETMAIVAGVSFDRSNTGVGYHLTFETLDTSGSSDGRSSAVKSQIIETDGYTIFDAARNATRRSNKKLYYGACEVVIVSSELAYEGIAPVLDLLNRDSEPRATIDLFISQASTAEEIIRQKSPNSSITSFALDKINTNNPKYLSKSPYVQLYQADNMLGGEGAALILPALDIVDNQGDKTSELSGTAVFRGDRLIGFLGIEESKYMLFIKNQVRGGLLLLNMESDVPDICLEISDSKTTVAPVLTGTVP